MMFEIIAVQPPESASVCTVEVSDGRYWLGINDSWISLDPV
jgi:hypothetical protein